MSEPRAPLQRIVVAGGGQLGVLAAVAMRRALPGCEVVLIGLPVEITAFADTAVSALPFTNGLHERLGIAESDIVLKAGGTHRLATRYFGWGAEGSHGMFPYGGGVDPALATGFAKNWGAGPRNITGERPAGSIAEVLVDARRFAPPPEDRATPLSDIDYAMRWHPPAYRDLLIGMAQSSGVQHVAGTIRGVEFDGEGNILAVVLEDGQAISADLFLDCSGPRTELASRHPAFAQQNWEPFLPTRRVWLGKPGQALAALEDRNSLLSEGWLSEVAGRDGLHTMLGTGDGIAQDAALLALGVEPVRVLGIAPARLQDCWMGNVVALGDASAQFEPLAGLHLDLAHRQLDLLLEMLPGRSIAPLERAEYNRRASLMLDGVRDALCLHYAAPRARTVFGEQTLPDGLGSFIDQYVRRGRTVFREEAPYLKQETTALLVALGYEAGVSPQNRSARLGPDETARRQFEDKANAALEYAPPYENWLASVLERR